MAQTTGGGTTNMIGNTPQVLDLTDGSGFFGDTFAMNNNGATFADHFTFSVQGTSPMNFDAIVSSISRTADTGLDFSGLALYRVGGGTGTGGTAGDTLITSGTSLQTGSMDVWTLSSDNLQAGDYYLLVSGNLVSDTAGSFGGAVMMAPVPEPETYGMMLAGLGVLGFLARRRKQAAANQA
ncbi:FxDxF family PEP-CTERM protein [Massilia norwichensis]|uniref:FxDxF family PEP-CTERM protein n=1 Tax=Massilia norwichensis TaxID=1442366 RepID=A0ABT2AEK4_9BURK|nr:FxDxF family PEP-CTERM protein [Massilia norwichensis]MCS0592644.1 FxDxF family PEP-CTERM protein [Massilia norwichensis]